MLCRKIHSLLGSGSSPNEALNHEINQSLKHNPELYATTLDFQLHIIREGKLCCHHLAMRTPQLRQYEPLLGMISSDATWQAWAEPYYTTDGRIVGTHTPPLLQQRQDIYVQIKNAAAEPPQHVAQKKPAGKLRKKPGAKFATPIFPLKKPGAKCKPGARKRTAFKLVRK